jgi:hypothetical protein
MSIQLSDDGTMDTLFRCTDCGQEFRFSVDAWSHADESSKECQDGDCDCRDTWIDEQIDEISDEHECEEDETEA